MRICGYNKEDNGIKSRFCTSQVYILYVLHLTPTKNIFMLNFNGIIMCPNSVRIQLCCWDD
ncbi:hypothetical protein BLOT_016520 [Blomia tropicalis]|nr:hypothetical protein BLOT_016520 [Blomia tropicalis]